MNDRATNPSLRPRAISRPTVGGLSLLLIVALAFGSSARTEHMAFAAAAMDGFGERAISPSVPTTAVRRSAPDKPMVARSIQIGQTYRVSVSTVPRAVDADFSTLDRLGIFELDLPPPKGVPTPDGKVSCS